MPQTTEIESNRAMVKWLNQASITTRNAPAATAASNDGIDPPGVPLDSIIQALKLHAQQPAKWPASALAERFDIVDGAALANALQYVQLFRVVEDSKGRPSAVAFDEKASAPPA